MARDGFFTGLDIGTSSIKVLVAEHVNGEMNVLASKMELQQISKLLQMQLKLQSAKLKKKQGFQSIQSMLGCLQTYYKSKQLKE